MNSTQREQQEVKQYLQKIYETNKLLLKCEARSESDASKINGIIKASLSIEVLQALENHLKTKYDKTTDQVIALKDPAILMKHIAAVADILYLESYSEEQTRQLLGTVINYYRSIDKMMRKQWETYTTFFARFSNSIRIIKQCAILLNDSSHIMSEEHTIETLFDCLKPDPKHHEMHSYCMSIKTEINKKQATLIDQIMALKRHVGDSDNIIKSEHSNHKEKEKKGRDKSFNSRRHDPKPSAGNNMVQSDEPSAYFSMQDLLNAEIDPAIIERLSKSSKTKAGQTAAQQPPSTSGKPAVPPSTNTFPNLAPTRGGHAPRGGRGRGGGKL